MRLPLDTILDPYKAKIVPLTRENMALGFGFGAEYPPDVWGKLGFKYHNGHDWAVPIGTPVRATHDGIVHKTIEEVSPWGTRGLGVTISQVPLDAMGRRLATIYWHLDSFSVTEGQQVKEGEVIGMSGNTGYSTGPHLHYAAKYYDSGYNSLPWFDPLTLFMNPSDEELRQLWIALFGRDPGPANAPVDPGCYDARGNTLGFILSEVMKSKEIQARNAVMAALVAKYNVK